MKQTTIFIKTLLSCGRRDYYSGSYKDLTAVATQIITAYSGSYTDYYSVQR
jgi:hypothetical protein